MAQETVSLATTDYQTIGEVAGPLLFVSKVKGASYGEMVEIRSVDGSTKYGQVIEMAGELAVVQVFGPTAGLDTEMTSVRFPAKWPRCPAAPTCWGACSTAWDSPVTAGRRSSRKKEREIIGAPINPWSRDEPRDFIQTGICAIDGLNTLVRGQKLPIFSGAGLPGNELAALIVEERQDHRGARSSPSSSRLWASPGARPPSSRVVRVHRSAGASRLLHQPRRRPHRRAAHDPALRPDRGRVPRLRAGHAGARDPDRHDQLLRSPARDLGRA